MNILESARIALRGLRANRLRSALTTLGIIIGVAAVIVLTALGNGIQTGVTGQFSQFTTQITVTPNPGAATGGRAARDLTDADVAALRNQAKAPDIASVSPVVAGAALLQVTGGVQHRSNVTGAESGLPDDGQPRPAHRQYVRRSTVAQQGKGRGARAEPGGRAVRR